MELSLGTLIVTIIVSALVGVVLIVVSGLVLHQIFVKKMKRRRRAAKRDVEAQDPPTLALRRKNTLQKGHKRDIPFVKTNSKLGQQRNHTSWTDSLNPLSSGQRTREDITKSRTSEQFSQDSPGLTDGTITIRHSPIIVTPSPTTLKREKDIFDPDYTPIARQSTASAPSRERTPSLSPRSHHRRIFSHPADTPRVPEIRRSSSVTPYKNPEQLSRLVEQRRSRSFDGILAKKDGRMWFRSNRDSAIDVTSPPVSSNSTKRPSYEMSDAKFLEYAASGQWLASSSTSAVEKSIKGPNSPLRSPIRAIGDYQETSRGHSPTTPLRNKGSDSQMSKGVSSEPQTPTTSDSHAQRTMHSVPSPSHISVLSPLSEFSEPPSSIDSVLTPSDTCSWSPSHPSKSATGNQSIDSTSTSNTIGLQPIPALQISRDQKRIPPPPSPTLSARSVDSEAFSEVNVSSLSGLTPRPRKVEEMFQPIEEEIRRPPFFGKASPFGDMTSQVAWSPSVVTLNTSQFPFPTTAYSPPSFPPPIEAPELHHIFNTYGLRAGDFKTPRESLAVSELERAVREMGDKLRWNGLELDSEEDDAATPVPGTPTPDKGKGVLRDTPQEYEHPHFASSKFEERPVGSFRLH